MTFVWPQALLAPALIPLGFLGCAPSTGGSPESRGIRGRRGVRARRPPGPPAAATAARTPPVVARAPAAASPGSCSWPDSRVWSSRSPGRRARSTCRARRARSSSPSTSRAAWPPPTSQPTRMEAAAAAADFVQRQPAERRRSASSPSAIRGIAVQQPTNDQAAVLAAIDRLTPAARDVARTRHRRVADRHRAAAAGPTVDYYTNRRPSRRLPDARPGRPHAPAVIVLLTDGENNGGPTRSSPPRPRPTVACGSTPSGSAARAARPSTSTASRSTPSSTPRRSSRSPTVTGGTYYAADDADDARRDLRPDRHGARGRSRRTIELTALFAAAGLALLLARRLLSLAWLGRSAVTFLWPGSCSSSLLVPLLMVGVYVWALRRRRPTGVRYSSLSLSTRRGRARRAATPPAVRAVRRALAALVLASAGRSRSRASRQPDHDHPGHGRVGQHVLGRHRARPGSSRPRPRPPLHRAPGSEHPDRDRRVQRLRPDRPGPDQRHGRLLGALREPDDRSPDGDRAAGSWPPSTPSPRSTRRSSPAPATAGPASSRRPSRPARTRRTSSSP